MSKIIINLPQSVITNFSGTFDSPQEERAYLYKNLIETLNKNFGDVLIKRTCNVTKIKNGKPEQEESSLDAIGFESAEIPSRPDWRPKDISGDLTVYEYQVGDRLYLKVMKYCKLQWILNNILKESIIEHLKSQLNKPVFDDEVKPDKNAIEKQLEDTQMAMEIDCVELYIYSLLSKIIFEKIKSEEDNAIETEQKELEKELEKPKEIPVEN